MPKMCNTIWYFFLDTFKKRTLYSVKGVHSPKQTEESHIICLIDSKKEILILSINQYSSTPLNVLIFLWHLMFAFSTKCHTERAKYNTYFDIGYIIQKYLFLLDEASYFYFIADLQYWLSLFYTRCVLHTFSGMVGYFINKELCEEKQLAKS